MIYEFEILATNKDFIPRSGDRFLKTEELCLRREIERPVATCPSNSDLICAISNNFARNFKLAGGAKRVCPGYLFRCN